MQSWAECSPLHASKVGRKEALLLFLLPNSITRAVRDFKKLHTFFLMSPWPCRTPTPFHTHTHIHPKFGQILSPWEGTKDQAIWKLQIDVQVPESKINSNCNSLAAKLNKYCYQHVSNKTHVLFIRNLWGVIIKWSHCCTVNIFLVS